MNEVSYTKVNWADSPSTSTPISAANLGKMDQGVKDCATAVNAKVKLGNTPCDVTFSLSGDVLTITTS